MANILIYELAEELESLKKTIDVLQWILFWGGIIFFISNLTIISQLPKIRRACEKLCCDKKEEEGK